MCTHNCTLNVHSTVLWQLKAVPSFRIHAFKSLKIWNANNISNSHANQHLSNIVWKHCNAPMSNRLPFINVWFFFQNYLCWLNECVFMCVVVQLISSSAHLVGFQWISHFPFRSPFNMIYANFSIKVFQFSHIPFSCFTIQFILSKTDWQINFDFYINMLGSNKFRCLYKYVENFAQNYFKSEKAILSSFWNWNVNFHINSHELSLFLLENVNIISKL